MFQGSDRTMPIFDYQSDCGLRFERLVASWRTANPGCPRCGGPTQRRPGRIAVVASAATPPDHTGAPQSWAGTGNGNPDVITHWRRTLDHRHDFEAKHPEFVTRRDAIAAHEGSFAHHPLTYKELATRAAATGDANQGAAQASQARKSSRSLRATGD
jgi:hypothetical protein